MQHFQSDTGHQCLDVDIHVLCKTFGSTPHCALNEGERGQIVNDFPVPSQYVLS